MQVERIERSPPTFMESADDYAGGKTLHGTFMPQNVFEEAAVQRGMTVEVACPKRWNARLVFWKWWSGKETVAQCRVKLKDDRPEERNVRVRATRIDDCYPVLGYLGIALVLFPIIGFLWSVGMVAKFFFPSLILLGLARVGMIIWPELIGAPKSFDVFLGSYVVVGGILKFYWWAITLGDDNDDEADDESEF